MYHWNVKALAEELKNNTVSEKEKMKYSLGYAIMVAFITSHFFDSREPLNRWDYATDVLSLISTAWGILYIFKKNGGKGSFIEKSLCLSWPLSLKFIVLTFLTLLPVAILLGIKSIETTTSDFLTFIIVGALSFFFYFRLGYWLEKT